MRADYESYPGKVYVRLEPDNDRPEPDLDAKITAEEHVSGGGSSEETVGEYVLNRLVKVRRVVTTKIEVEDI